MSRYYNIVDKLERVHGGATGAQEQKKTFVYDADHERRRKEQLRSLKRWIGQRGIY